MRLSAAACALIVAACKSDPAPPPERVAVPPSAAPSATPAQQSLIAAARARGLSEARALEPAARALADAARARDVSRARTACLELRRAWRRIEPVARVLAPVAASQIDPENEEPDEAPQRVGLRVIFDALLALAIDWQLVDAAVKTTAAAVRLATRELSIANWQLRPIAFGISRAIFEWGRRLDGSRAERDPELEIDVVVAARSLLGWTSLMAASAKSTELVSVGRELESWIEKHGARAEHKLEALLISGKLGAELRKAAALLGVEPPRPPFLPRWRTRSADWQEPVQIATFPALSGPALSPSRVELGAQLFFDRRLSSDGSLACAGCHRADHELAFGSRRPLTVAKKEVVRDVPPLWNVAYDAMHFWDGRASTLSDQVRIAVENDMGGRWDEIVHRLERDPELSSGFRSAFPEGLTAETVRAAIAEFERTLVRDTTPLDRFMRGEQGAMSDELSRGFDVYFGKARCSRCHRLPLTSGTLPPRFVRAEAAAIGVPKAPGSRELDPDRGRGAATRLASEEHAFKVPTLRNLAKTAPYFHNGGFATLEQVVDFYEKGSGGGLGIELPNFDPDAAAFTLSASERRALIAFLREGLRDDEAR